MGAKRYVALAPPQVGRLVRVCSGTFPMTKVVLLVDSKQKVNHIVQEGVGSLKTSWRAPGGF